jgi:hypothetical protein
MYSLCVCCECRRVCNSAPRVDKQLCEGGEFCETGIAKVIVLRAPDGARELFCSQRSSAALKSAIAAQRQAQERRVDEDMLDVAEEQVWALEQAEQQQQQEQEQDAPSPQAARDADADADASAQSVLHMAHDGYVASRMRRDCHRAVEQRQTSRICGEEPLLVASLLGRAVRIFGRWHALCSVCGNFVKVDYRHCVSADVCCLVCSVPKGCAPVAPPLADAPDAPATAGGNKCRFCDAREPMRGNSFAQYHSPHDQSGDNASLDPSVRSTRWCTRHDRRWLRRSLLTMPTPLIIAHIISQTAPGLETLKEAQEANLLPLAPPPPAVPALSARAMSKLTEHRRRALLRSQQRNSR